jgi:anti-sigma-K factor RskA
VTRVRFRPDQNTSQIKAFAISLEREGGVPKREGPIVMIGNA